MVRLYFRRHALIAVLWIGGVNRMKERRDFAVSWARDLRSLNYENVCRSEKTEDSKNI